MFDHHADRRVCRRTCCCQHLVLCGLLQLSTKLMDKGDLRDSLKLVYDFNNRFGEWALAPKR